MLPLGRFAILLKPPRPRHHPAVSIVAPNVACIVTRKVGGETIANDSPRPPSSFFAVSCTTRRSEHPIEKHADAYNGGGELFSVGS